MKSFSDLKFRSKLLVAILPIVVLAIALVATVAYNAAAENLKKQQNETMTKLVEKTVGEAESWLEGQEMAAVLMSDNAVFQEACRGNELEEAQLLLTKMLREYPVYENLFLATPEGKLFLMGSGESDIDIDISQMPVYAVNVEKARQRQVWTGDVGQSPVTGRPVALITAPILDHGKLIGIMGTPIELNEFSKRSIGSVTIGESGYLYMVDERGITLAHPNTEYIFELDVQDHEWGRNIVSARNGVLEYAWEGREKVAIFEQDKNKGWIVVATSFLDEYTASIRKIQHLAWLWGGLAIVLVFFVTLFLSTKVTNIIQHVVNTLKDIAQGEGDLTQRIDVNSKDEVGELAHWFNVFMDKLHDIINQVRLNAEEVATAASQISSTASQLAAGSEEQTVQTSEVAASVQEMTAAILENSQNATQTATLAEQANDKAGTGAETMKETQSGMNEIVSSAGRTGEIIDSLSGRAEQIGAVIQVIEDIADQTNLLALNAAIEAARAGEQGRGFAVVADEVRKLAERTTKATSEIGDTIKAIQNDTFEAAKSMNVAKDMVSRGQTSTKRSESELTEIVSAVTSAMEMIHQIAAATEQMSSGAEQISKNIDGISSVAHQSSSGAEELSVAAEELNRQTENLRALVGQFKL